MYQELKMREFNKRFNQIQNAKNQELILTKKQKKELHIVYVMSHVGVCGGVKIIFEQTNRLKDLGIQVTIVSHFSKPTWFPIKAKFHQVTFDIELAKGIPCCDVIVATYWDHIQTCIDTGIAPVVYFEQGDFHLFDYQSMDISFKEFIQKQIQLPEFIFTVSNNAASFLKTIYNRDAKVIHNAVDEKIFKLATERYKHEKPYILMMGGEDSNFKGLDDIVQAYDLLKQDGYNIDLLWITPYQPSERLLHKVSAYFVNPSQELIAKLYRGAQVYVSASHYESFSLPPLEAMACGCPVVTTGNQGVLEYAIHQENSLICNIQDPPDLAEKIKIVISNSKLSQNLIDNGLQTVNNFNWEKIIGQLLDYYKRISGYQPKAKSKLTDWKVILNSRDFIQKDEYEKFTSLLKITEADMVKIPVIYTFEGLPQIARWEIAAIKKNYVGNMIDSCYTYVQPKNKFSILNNEAYLDFYKRDFEMALQRFDILFQQSTDPAKKQVYFKWIILSLHRLQRRYEAKEKLSEYIKEHPYNSEFYYLYCLLAKESGEDCSYHLNMVDLLGDAATFSEHLLNIKDAKNKP